MLSNSYPEVRQDLQTLSSLIGQSRIENAVHYPSDILYGRLVGETLANCFLEKNKYTPSKDLKKKHQKRFVNYCLDRASETYNDNHIDNLIEDIASFVYRTNTIEQNNVDYNDCKDATQMILQGYPVDYASKNDHITSQFNCIIAGFNCDKIDSLSKIRYVHNFIGDRCLERGEPGEIRNYSHNSPNGVSYSEPYEIYDNIKNLFKLNLDPWSKHVVYELIHPFCDGNGRSGRIMLLSDLDFNFRKANDYIGEDYIKNLTDVMDSNHDKIKSFL